MPVVREEKEATGGNILTCDNGTFDLILLVDASAKSVRSEWINTVSTSVNELDSVSDNRVLVNFLGRTTVLSDYEAYDLCWKQGLYKNPLEVKWLDFDKGDRRMIRYLEVIIEVLTEQIVLWAVDQDTRVCQAFILLCQFADDLELLYDHIVSDCLDNIKYLTI